MMMMMSLLSSPLRYLLSSIIIHHSSFIDVFLLSIRDISRLLVVTGRSSSLLSVRHKVLEEDLPKTSTMLPLATSNSAILILALREKNFKRAGTETRMYAYTPKNPQNWQLFAGRCRGNCRQFVHEKDMK